MRWLCASALTALLVAHVARAGGFASRPPATVYSRAHPALRAQEPLLEFLAEVGERVPAGASIALRAEGDADLLYLLALGQLPWQRVVPIAAADAESTPASRPEYVAAFAQPWRQAGYRRVGRPSGGWLYRRSQP